MTDDTALAEHHKRVSPCCADEARRYLATEAPARPSGLLREALEAAEHVLTNLDTSLGHSTIEWAEVRTAYKIVRTALAAEPGLDVERYEMCGACFHPMHVAPCRLSVRLTTDEEGFCYCIASEATYAARETALVCDRLCIHVDGCDRPAAILARFAIRALDATEPGLDG